MSESVGGMMALELEKNFVFAKAVGMLAAVCGSRIDMLLRGGPSVHCVPISSVCP